MLLIACSAITTISADPTATTPQKKPEQVIAQLNYVANTHGLREGQTYSVTKNPNTGIIESSIRIVPIAATMVGKGPYFDYIMSAFMHDEPLAYQFLHIQPGSNENFELKVITDNGQTQGRQRIRTNKDQEMWLMCCKNPENPQLRDAYAIVWEVDYRGRKPMDTGSYPMNGTIYMITSLRPDLYEKNMSSAGLLSDNKNTFTIDGRVGYDLNDSLYVVYMADTAEELNNVKDSDFVATMPVVNKRFTFSVELDKPKVGRIRTVMPDGSLCHLWTNLDFVPGETYRITTHNGYYDEDRDYEQRVGRYSGKSLLNDLQRRGIDDQMLVLTDEVPEEFVKVQDGDGVTVEPEIHLPQSVRELEAWRNSLSPQQWIAMEQKSNDLRSSMKMIEGAYEVIGSVISQGPAFKSRLRFYVDQQCDEILKRNKELDKAFSDLVKAIKAANPPQGFLDEMYSKGYKEVLDVFTKQNTSFNEIYKAGGSLSKKAQKTQKYINSLTKKYIDQMSKHMREMK